MWSWRGAVALVLALAVGVGWVVLVVTAVNHPGALSRTSTAGLFGLAGTLLGGVVGFLAGKDTER